jgi:hypothetical protein
MTCPPIPDRAFGPACPVCEGAGLASLSSRDKNPYDVTYCPACGGEGSVPPVEGEACGPDTPEWIHADEVGKVTRSFPLLADATHLALLNLDEPCNRTFLCRLDAGQRTTR